MADGCVYFNRCWFKGPASVFNVFLVAMGGVPLVLEKTNQPNRISVLLIVISL